MSMSFGEMFFELVVSIGIYVLFRWAKGLRDS